MPLTPRQAMQLALDEGRKGVGFVAPNPLVGCVILDKNFELLGRGYHARVGEAHAEVNALASVTDKFRLQGAHVFVTLEPCAHEGRTPSCAKALAKLPLASVTYGLEDPNPLVAGRGAEIVRAAGIRCELFSDLRTELEELCEIFLTNMRLKRPFVALKVGASLDGKIALRSGESQWITGEESRAYVQTLRGAYDAVAVGSGTFLKDDPSLNSRDPRFASRPNRAVIFDRRGRCKFANSKLTLVRPNENIFWITDSADSSEVTKIAATELPTVLTQLYKSGVGSILLEGGTGVIGEFLRAKLVDRVYAFVAPKILGHAPSWSDGLAIARLAEAPTLENPRWQSFGEDMMLTGRLT